MIKNTYISDDQIKKLLKIYQSNKESEFCKIFPNQFFGYVSYGHCFFENVLCTQIAFNPPGKLRRDSWLLEKFSGFGFQNTLLVLKFSSISEKTFFIFLSWKIGKCFFVNLFPKFFFNLFDFFFWSWKIGKMFFKFFFSKKL